jgi:6-phosphogluconolactonase (cycloisomerase 2 family)
MKRTIFNITLTLTILLTSFSMSTLAQGKFVYTNNDRRISNSVSGFKVNANGSIELLPGMPVQTGDGGGAVFETLGSSQKVAIAGKGPYLFAANDDQQTITVYKIDPVTGALAYIETEDIGGGGNGDSIAMTVSPDEQFLYAGNPNHDRIHALHIFDDGTLAEIELEQLPEGYNATDLMVSPNGKFLVAQLFHEPADIDGRLAVFSINQIGAIEAVEGSPFKGSNAGRVGNAIFNCEGNLLFVAKEFTNKLSFDVFSFAKDGKVSLIDGAPFVFNVDEGGTRIGMSPNGKFLYATALGKIYALKILASGALEMVVFSPFPTTYQGNSVSDIAFDNEGKYLFASFSDQHVESLRINPDGSLSTIEGGLASTNEDNGVGQSHLNSLVAFPLPKTCKIMVPDDITITNDQFTCQQTVDYDVTMCGNDCGGPVTCKPPSGSSFPVGTTTVICTAEGLADAEFTVTVKDIDFPFITAPEDITVSTDPDKCSAIVNFKVSATDNCDANPKIEIDFPSGTEFPKGETTIHIKATDKAGNVTNESFKVTVVDQQTPIINCSADQTVNNQPNSCGAVVEYTLPGVSDNCPDVGAPSCNPPSGMFFPIGTTDVLCSVSDASGNGSQCTFKVTVKDIQPPQITCPADKTAVTASACDAAVIVTYPAPMVSDNCPNNLVVVCNPPSGSSFPLGSTTVTCTATDGGGNQAQCSFKVTVFNAWLQDESNSATVLLFNTVSGEYRLCYPGVNQPITGVGTIIKKGCMATLEHNAADRRLLAKIDPATKKGTASYQSPPGSLKCTILDQDVTNNTTLCQ